MGDEMSDTWPALFKRAEVTRTGSYQFEDPDNVKQFPSSAGDILETRRKFEKEIVDARGDIDLALNQYNGLIDDYNNWGREAARVLRDEYGMLAQPTIKPKLDLAGPEAHGTAPPNIPTSYKEQLHDIDDNGKAKENV